MAETKFDHIADLNVRAFCEIATALVNFIDGTVPSLHKKMKVVKMKLEIGIEMAPDQLCAKFADELKPFAMLILKNDDTFFLEKGTKLPLLGDIDMKSVWPSFSPAIKAEIWKRLNAALTMAAIGSRKVLAQNVHTMGHQTGGGDMSTINSGDLGSAIQEIMPMVQQMLPALMGQMQGGVPSGITPQAREAAQRAARQAASPDSQQMQMMQSLIGGNRTKRAIKSKGNNGDQNDTTDGNPPRHGGGGGMAGLF